MKVCLDCLDRCSLEIICCAIVRFEISTKTRIELVLDPDTANVFIVSTSSKFLQPGNGKSGCLVVFPAGDRYLVTNKAGEYIFSLDHEEGDPNHLVRFFEWSEFSVAVLDHTLERIKQMMKTTNV